MVRRAVIALAVVLPDQLPIAVLDDRALEGDPGVDKLVRRKILFDLGPEWLETRRDRRDANKDVSADAFAVRGLEAELRPIKPDVRLTRADQAAVQVVDPLMI